tara:strand:+ start:273 stop:494 length:222 start_codon:yes stop_codon:yes gene_type:complete
MKAVKGKNNILSLISSTEARMFNKVDIEKFVDVNTLNERDLYIAEELYKKNVLRKVKKGTKIGYKTFEQKTIL